MKTLQQAWDFVLGALVLGAAPVFTLFTVWAALSFFGRDAGPNTGTERAMLILFMAASLLAPLIAFLFAVRWRMHHRLLPIWMMWIEVPVGLLAGGGFVLFTAGVWAFGSPNL
jgi:hypothetical protein